MVFSSATYILSQISLDVHTQNAMRICSAPQKGPTVGESNTWIAQKTSLRNHWVMPARDLPSCSRRGVADPTCSAYEKRADILPRIGPGEDARIYMLPFGRGAVAKW